jgi:hypothetical protein
VRGSRPPLEGPSDATDFHYLNLNQRLNMEESGDAQAYDVGRLLVKPLRKLIHEMDVWRTWSYIESGSKIARLSLMITAVRSYLRYLKTRLNYRRSLAPGSESRPTISIR